MFKSVILIAVFACFVNGLPAAENRNVQIVTRAQWGARAPTGTTRLVTPAPMVVIHHSYSPGACTTNAACQTSMRSMQNFHMNSNGWADIGYNFAVGGDGLAYEGRGWTTVGAHAAPQNSRSIGIVLIGNWSNVAPPARQLQAAQELIRRGVQLGHIRANYELRGHRQISATACPGNALFNVIRTWSNFVSFPTNTNSSSPITDDDIEFEILE